MTIQDLLAAYSQKIKKIDPAFYNLEAEILLSRVLKKPRAYLLAHGDQKLAQNQISKFKALAKKRLEGVPLAYLLGSQNFYGFDFYVNKNVLIPRPETELLIANYELIINNLKNKNILTIDVGTGSGCIAITLAKLFKKKNIKFLATDISPKALLVAKKNAKKNGVSKNIKFLPGDLLEPILKNKKLVISNYSLVITANLPYLTPSQFKNSPTIQKEPKLALVSGADGLEHYRRLFSQIKTLRSSLKNAKIIVLCEINPGQARGMKKIINQNLPKAQIEIQKDLCAKDRLAIVKL